MKPLPIVQEDMTVAQHVQNILAAYGNAESLTFEEFSVFLAQTPFFFKVFEDAFMEKVWKTHNSETSTETFVKKTLKNSQISGVLYVKSEEKLQSTYGVLRDRLLLLYESAHTKVPYELILMEGCYTEIIGDFYITNKFGITISHQSPNFQEVMLWSDSRKERDNWLKHLEEASKYRKFKEFYALGEKIGHGKFSDVYICTEHLNYTKWAVKVVNKSKLSVLERELLQSEINILRLIKHPCIIKVKEVFDSKKHILIVMELIEGGELFDRIIQKKVFSEYATSRIIKQLLEAISYLHDLGIMHRDIKPENILLTDDSDIPHIKLADFGLSKLAGVNDIQNLACGTLGYVAPEVLSQSGYSYKVDIWSTGIITYLLLRGRLPFDHKEKQVLIDLTLRGTLSFEDPYWKSFTPFAIDFLNKVIQRNPQERLSSLQALNHLWIKNADILIPRAIDKRKMEDLFIERGVSSTNFGKVQYREFAVDGEKLQNFHYEVHSMPQIFDEVKNENKIEVYNFTIGNNSIGP